MTAVLVASAALLGLAAVLVLVRMTNGPTILDRGVALEVLVAISICAIALYTAHTRELHALPALLALSLLGFIGAVSIARYAPGAEDVEARGDLDADTEAARDRRGVQSSGGDER